MMLERFTDDARSVLIHAQGHARRLGHRWRHGDRVRRVLPALAPPPEGRYPAGDQAAEPIPFTPGARKCLQNTLREAVAQHQTGIGVEHIALGLLVTNRGLVPPILDEAGLSAPALRVAILDRYRPAS
jgi:Clp amino terminal domain, pathogenicity island component